MTKIALTGGTGFLGWHTRSALRDLMPNEPNIGAERIAVGSGFALSTAVDAVTGADRVIHLAGVNRGTDDEVRAGNAQFAQQLAEALARSPQPPRTVVYANSIQAGNGTVYGDAKAHAAEILAKATSEVGAEFVDVHLPNLFGEHGQPFYNSVTATFAHQLVVGAEPVLRHDRDLTLLHAQNAADVLLGRVPVTAQRDLVVQESVSGLLDRLRAMSVTYRRGEIPDISSAFDRDLFNTYRSFTFPGETPIQLTKHEDARGSFFEVIRAHGGSGQTSFSTTVPGVTRGDHFHRRKVERFIVVSGSARIRLRRLSSDHVLAFDVTGNEPVAIDMPTMWTHSIENTGTDELLTAFWTNELFDSEQPDTIPESVLVNEQAGQSRD